MAQTWCVKCQKRPAVVKMVRIVSGVTQTVTLCEQCAAESSPYQKQHLLQEAIEKLFAKLVQQQSEEEAGDAEHGPCPRCGRSFAAFRKTFMLGCPECYAAFATAIDPQIERIHGSTRHVGRMPPSAPPLAGDRAGALEVLQHEMTRAVAREDFETATRLRDQIRHLQDGAADAVPKMREM